MPAALAVNWDAIKMAFIGGATLPELAKANGIGVSTLTTRASRENWSQWKKKPVLRHDVVAASSDIWTRRAEEAKDDWHKITKKVRKHLVENADADVVVAKADKIKAINEIERKNLGLDKESTNPHVNVGIQLIGDKLREVSGQEIDDFSSELV